MEEQAEEAEKKKEEEEEKKEKEGAEPGSGQTETASEACAAESYMTMMAQQTEAGSGCGRRVDACIQKNISFDGKPGTPTGCWNGGFGEIFSLRDQLKQAEEKALQVQREVGRRRAGCDANEEIPPRAVIGLLLFHLSCRRVIHLPLFDRVLSGLE